MARSLPRRTALGLAVAAAAVVLIGALLTLVLLFDASEVTRRAAELVAPRIAAALGREVTLGEAQLRLLPDPRVRIEGLSIAGRKGEPPLVEARSLDLEIALWPLLVSLGTDVEIRALALVRPTVTLVRARDGAWSFEGLGAAPRPPAREEAAPDGDGARVAVGSVRIEQGTLRLVDRAGGADDAAVVLSMVDLEASGVGPGLPLDARLAAALADDRQNLFAQLSIARLPAGIPRRPADWPAVQGAVRLGALALRRIRPLLPGDLGAIVRGGTVGLDARLGTGEGPEYRIEGAGDLRDVRLRDQVAAGRFRAALSWSPARPDAARMDLTDIVLRGEGVDLGGHASFETGPLRAWFVVTGPLLDLDAVLGTLSEDRPKAAAPPAPLAPLVPEATRRAVRAASARGTLAIGEVRGGRLRATDVKAQAVLSGGTLALEDLDAQLFGGRVTGSGSRASLVEEDSSWHLAVRLSSLDLGQALAAFADASPLAGALDGTLDVGGAGTDWESVGRTVSGRVVITVKDGALTTTDLGSAVLRALAEGLAAAGKAPLAEPAPGAPGGRTALRDLEGGFEVKDGLLAARALSFGSDVGEVKLGGRIGLDGRLDLAGGVAVPRERLAQVASGLSLPRRLDVPLALGGTLGAPQVEVRAEEVARRIASGRGRQARKVGRGEAERAPRKAVEGLDRPGGEKR